MNLSSVFENTFVVGGVLVIVALSCIAAFLWFKVYRKGRDQAKKLHLQAAAHATAQEEKKQSVNKSIQLLAYALTQHDLSLTEASIRIAGLLDYLDVEKDIKNEFSAFFQLRDLTKHIPVLESWQNLSHAEQNKFDLERIQHEATYNDFVMDAAKRILGCSF